MQILYFQVKVVHVCFCSVKRLYDHSKDELRLKTHFGFVPTNSVSLYDFQSILLL